MTPHTSDLAAMISTRICHDLINPIGAISNGLELLVELNQAAGPEIGLINDSVASANAKLGFFRVAYGDARAESELPTDLAAKILDAMYSVGRFRARWLVKDDPLYRAQVKLMFLLVQCVESSLPLGGECLVTRDGATWVVDGSGARLNCNDGHWATLEHGAEIDGPASSNVHFSVAQVSLARLGGRLTKVTREGGVNVRVDL